MKDKQYLIKWTRKDYGKLRSSVNRFNKRIDELQQLDLNVKLPTKLNYSDLKEDILTRKQLNQTLSTLKRLNFKSAMDEVEIASGEIISKWEFNDVIKRREIAIDYVTKQIEEETKKQTYKGLKNDRLIRLEKTLKTLENFQNKEGDKLRYALERIKKIGNIDYEIKKAKTYRDNFMYALKDGASTFKNYKVLKERLEGIKNPKDFYEFVSQNDTLMDLFLWYDDETGTLKYGGFKSNEDAFNNALIDLGISISND